MRAPSLAYLPAIDGLRAIAVLAVIIFHADFLKFLPGGFTGVDMFFVISGYVISQSLSERGSTSFAGYLKDFYRRRCLRILPALLVVLLVSFLLSAMFMPQFWLSEQINRTGLAAFFGVSNVVLAWNTDTYFAPGGELNLFLHTWSLGVEEQFYVIFPVVFFIWLRYRAQSFAAWVVLPVLAVVSLGVSALQTQTDQLSAFYLLPGRFWELAAGALLFQIIDKRRGSVRSRVLVSGLLVCGFILLMAGFLFAQPERFPFPWALSTVAGAVLMIAALALPADGHHSPLQGLLQWRVITYLGRLSYSLYLWHWPVAVFLRWTTGTESLVVQLLYPVIVLALAAASYHWVETPIRTGKSPWQRRAWSTGAVSVAVMGLGAGLAFWMTENTERLSLSQTRDTYTWYAYKHYPQEDIEPLKDKRLEGRQLFVIGDSHTAAYRTMLNLVSLKLGVQVVDYEQGGCGVVNLMAADPAKCAERRVADFKDIEARAKPGDVVFLASLRMPELQGRSWWLGREAGFKEAIAEQSAQKSAAAKEAAENVLGRLEASKVHILIDAPKPLYKASPNRCSDWFNRSNPICLPGLIVERYRLEQLRAPQMALLDQLQAEHPDLVVWDPFPVLCPAAICSAYDKDGKPLFFDSNHLSGQGNRVLEPSFTKTLLSIWTQPG